MSETNPPDPSSSMADMIVRYDLAKMREEIKQDFTPDSGSHRLLNQSDISKRFKRRRAARAKPKPDAS
ncbi:MAG: hypothetical protein HOH58_12720 [Opitutaceae bacterium]|jgi:hypothetical protein|nr:hypothetical protein [Opitutaceae bacterium]